MHINPIYQVEIHCRQGAPEEDHNPKQQATSRCPGSATEPLGRIMGLEKLHGVAVKWCSEMCKKV
jgi:hypothetical protein